MTASGVLNLRKKVSFSLTSTFTSPLLSTVPVEFKNKGVTIGAISSTSRILIITFCLTELFAASLPLKTRVKLLSLLESIGFS